MKKILFSMVMAMLSVCIYGLEHTRSLHMDGIRDNGYRQARRYAQDYCGEQELVISEASKRWVDNVWSGRPANKPKIITKFDKEVTAKILEDCYGRLDYCKKHLEIIREEYVSNKIDMAPIQKVLRINRKITNGRYWRLLREREVAKYEKGRKSIEKDFVALYNALSELYEPITQHICARNQEWIAKHPKEAREIQLEAENKNLRAKIASAGFHCSQLEDKIRIAEAEAINARNRAQEAEEAARRAEDEARRQERLAEDRRREAELRGVRLMW